MKDKDKDKAKEQLLDELAELRKRNAELETHETERKKAEKALRESKEKFHSLILNIPDVTWTTDNKGHTSYVSLNIKEVYGYTSEEIYKGGADLWLGRIHPDDIKQVKKAFALLFTKNKIFNIEYRIKRKDGKWIWLHDRAVKTYKKDGILYADGIFSEITESKQADEALRKSQQQLSRIYDSVGDVLFYLAVEPDDCFRFLSINQAFLSSTGLTEDQIVGKRIEEVIPEPSVWMVRDNYKKAIEENRVIRWEETSEYPTGVKVGSVSIAPFFDDNGICTHLIGSVQDITEHKKAEEARIESEEKLKLSMKSAREGMWEWDFTTDQVYFDDVCLQILGYNPGEIQKKGEWWWTQWHPDDVAPTKKAVKDYLEGHAENYSVEFRLRNKSGKYVWISSNGVVLRKDENNKPLYMIGIHQDITERKIAEEDLHLHSIVLTNMDEGVYLIRASDGIIVYTNPAFERMFGYDPGAMIGKHVSIVNAPTQKDPEERAKEIIEVLNKTGKWEGEVNNIKKDGTSFWCYSIVSTFEHYEYGPVWISVHTDITERKKVEQFIRTQAEVARNMAEGAYIVRLRDVIIRWASPRFEGMFGYEPGEMIGKHASIINAPSDLTPIERSDEIMEVLRRTGEWHGEVENIKKDGTPFWCYASVSTFTHPEYGEVLLAVHTDITERKKAEEQLNKHLELMKLSSEVSSLFISVPLSHIDDEINSTLKKMAQAGDTNRSSLFLFSDDLTTITNTHEWCASPVDSQIKSLQGIPFKTFGYHEKQLRNHETIAISSIDDYPPEAKGEIEWVKKHGFRSFLFIPLLKKGKLYGALGFYGEIGKEIAWQDFFVELLRIIGDVFVSTLERKKAMDALRKSQKDLRNLTAHIQSVREDERRSVAREIHDDVGQNLAALKMDMYMIEKKLPSGQKPLIDRMKAMMELTDKSIQTVRKIHEELRPSLLEGLGLVEAIESYTEEFEDRTEVKYELHIEPESIDLSEERSLAFFRILQESMTNVRLHAGATKVNVNIKEKNGKLELKVKDKGVGVTEEQLTKSRSFGIMGIRERADFLQGKVKINGIPDKGTTVKVTIPLKTVNEDQS